MHSVKPVPRSMDVEWLRWLIERIGPLGTGPVVETFVVPGSPPKLVQSPTGPWPFKSRAKIDSFRSDLGRFAARYAPHLVRPGKTGEWKPSLDTTQRVLERLPGVYSWAKDAEPVMLSGQIVMSLGTDRSGGPSVGFMHDAAFDIVRAFVGLSVRFIGRFRSCPSCRGTFVARRSDQSFCSTACAGRERVRTHRKRKQRLGHRSHP
jgi:hypothetical protein